MTRATLDSRVLHDFNLLNSRRKVEFLAYFPDNGTTQKELADCGVFNHGHKSMIHYHLQPYKSFLEVPKKADNKGCKIMKLNEEGLELQRMARYMVLIDQEIKGVSQKEDDYLSVFFEKGSPNRMLEILIKVYSNGASAIDHFARYKRDRSTSKIIEQLKSFDLINVDYIKEKRTKRHVQRTMTGYHFYFRLLKPTMDYITATGLKENRELFRYTEKNWGNFVKKNGHGWNGKTH